MTIKPEDLSISTYSTNRGGFAIPDEKGIKLVHIPSGISVMCDSEISAYANKIKAMMRLQEILKAWDGPPALSRIQQLEQDNETLKASLALCQEQNKKMLEMLRAVNELLKDVHLGIDVYIQDRVNNGIAAVSNIIAKIESRNKEGE